jgi:flagellar capping protein FliD
MAGVRLPGLLTGIDTNALITQLMAIEGRTLKRYQQRKAVWDERKDALSSLEGKLSSLRNSVRALSDADELRMFSAASSDTDILTAEASYNSFEGNHTVVVNRLATAERWVHKNGLEYSEDYVGAGTFIYSYNHKETILTTTDTTTLEDLVGLINNDANNPGVTANLLYYNDAYHLVLNGNDAGTDYQISINSSNTEVWQSASPFTVDGSNASLSTKITALDQFDFNGGAFAGDEKITISGKKHDGTAVNAEIAINKNTKLTHIISEINDAFGGDATATLENGKIVLTDNTCGTSQMELDLTYDPGITGPTTFDIPAVSRLTQGGTVPANPEDYLAGFTSSDFTETQSAQDSQIRVDGYPPAVPELQTLSWSGQASGGHFHLTYNGQTTGEILHNADLAAIQAALEALPNVSAGDITVGGDTLTADSSSMTFTFAPTAGDVSMIAIDTSAITGLSNESFAETIKGDDGWINRSSNTVTDAIQGVTLHLHNTGTIDLTLTRDIQAAKDKLNSMITAYNTAITYIQEKTGYNDTLKTAGILMGDYVVSSIKSQLTMPLIERTSGFISDIDAFLMPGQIGLQLDRDGMLSLDSAAFDEAIADDYLGTLAIIGADKTGSSNSNTIGFYGASNRYTSAGTFDVEVTVNNNAIAFAQIKKEGETTWRTATWQDNVVIGNSEFDDDGNPLYPENGLQLTVDLSASGIHTYSAKVRVKQGFAGALEDTLDDMLKVTTGSIQIDQQSADDQIKILQDKMDSEQGLLDKRQSRLITQFAAMEKTLALLQNQMAALGFSTA